jgi:hypothetical protein
MISKIENGSALAITIKADGENLSLKLGLFKISGGWSTGPKFEYYYFGGEDKEVYALARGTYSGGTTGAGISPQNIIHVDKDTGYSVIDRGGLWVPEDEITEYTKRRILISEDPKEIDIIVGLALKEEEKRIAEMRNRKSEIADKINLLPKKVQSKIVPFLVSFRSDAIYKPSYSGEIQGGGYGWFEYSNDRRGHFDPKNFITRDGKCQTHKFVTECSCYREWKLFLGVRDPKQILLSLKNELDSLNLTVSELKSN